MSMADLIEARDLSVGYEAADGQLRMVLDRVSFNLAPGVALGIVGESGSGKTTLGRALLGHLRDGGRFTGGTLSVAGVDVTDPRAVARSGLRGRVAAMAPQNPLSSLTHHLTVGAQIEEILRLRAGMNRTVARDRAVALMAETGLPDPARLARRYPHQLSGGQRQRVIIAAALACDPALLVLDEPTSALDKSTEAQVLDLVAGIRTERGMSLVLISHDLNVVARVCDRVMVMRHGCLVEDGAVEEVYSAPKADYTRDLLEAARPPKATPLRARGAGGPLLRAESLDFAYPEATFFGSRPGKSAALSDISFDLHRGETLGVIGESGSGKSTLASLVCGLRAPTRGRLLFDSTALGALAARRNRQQLRRIQIVFQDPLSSLNPRLRCGESVMHAMRHFLGVGTREARERSIGLFAQLGLEPDLFERYPRQLSGGQQQRVAIARAFAAEPDLLICDEVTSALDAAVQGQVLDLLGSMQTRSGCAILLITHDLGVLRRMAGRTIVLDKGRMAESGVTADVFSNPRSTTAAALLSAAHQIERRSTKPIPTLETTT
jgi:peptide/nickel transport system ATP-binding protein